MNGSPMIRGETTAASGAKSAARAQAMSGVTRVYTTISLSSVKSTHCMDRLCCCKQKSSSLQPHLYCSYCSSAGARVWVCALPEHVETHLCSVVSGVAVTVKPFFTARWFVRF